jgi:hypothetical protein
MNGHRHHQRLVRVVQFLFMTMAMSLPPMYYPTTHFLQSNAELLRAPTQSSSHRQVRYSGFEQPKEFFQKK